MSRPIRFSREEAREAIAASRSFSEALRKLGLRPAGGNHATLKKYAALWGISIDHFDRNWASRTPGRRARIPLSEILVERSTYSRAHLKDRLFEEGLKERRCEICGQGEFWLGHRMALILDHINGHGDDNRLQNLRVVCPNCAATFETHCGRKNALPSRERLCGRCAEPFTPKYRTHRYCSQFCGSRASVKHKGVPRFERRKVERPPLSQLRLDVELLGYVGTGRKYGVSDNAVRKWIAWYEAARPQGAVEAVTGTDASV